MRADRRILVVDDDAKAVSLVKLYLKNDGHEVLCAYDGARALRRGASSSRWACR